MDKFEKMNLIKMKKISLEELKKYYVELRNYEYESSIPLKGIKLRQKIEISKKSKIS